MARRKAGSAGGDTIAKLIEEASADKAIKALVVRVDSGGGSVLASERIRGALAEAKAHGLPIIGSMGPVAASGGYWVSTAADMIFAQPSTITGSIGVFAIIPSFEGTLKTLHIGADGVKSTPYSGTPDVLAGLSPDTRTLLQASVEDIYRRFTGLVAAARHLTPARVDQIGQGRVWAGTTALQLGSCRPDGRARRGNRGGAEARAPASRQPHHRYRTQAAPRLRVPQSGVRAGRWRGGRARSGRQARADCTQKVAAVAAGALGMIAHPSVQASCAECAAFDPAPPPIAETAVQAAMLRAVSGPDALRSPRCCFAALLSGCMATKIVTVPARVAAKAVGTGAKVVGHVAKTID